MLNNSFLRIKKDIKSKYLGGDDILNLLSSNFVIPKNFTYRLVRVPNSMVARPDLVSMMMYNDDNYGDLICKINNISNPFELNEEDVLIIPSLEYIEEFYRNDSTDDTIGISDKLFSGNRGVSTSEDEDESIKLKMSNPENDSVNTVDDKEAVKQNRKRRPNQASEGEVRYRIDKNRRIVTY